MIVIYRTIRRFRLYLAFSQVRDTIEDRPYIEATLALEESEMCSNQRQCTNSNVLRSLVMVDSVTGRNSDTLLCPVFIYASANDILARLRSNFVTYTNERACLVLVCLQCVYMSRTGYHRYCDIYMIRINESGRKDTIYSEMTRSIRFTLASQSTC